MTAPQLRGRCSQSESQTAGGKGEEQLSREDIHQAKSSVFSDDSVFQTALKLCFNDKVQIF